jgi:hypothetical protein
MTCPTGTAARSGCCPTDEDVQYVVRCAVARLVSPASFYSCSRRTHPWPSPPSRGGGVCHPTNSPGARFGGGFLAATRPTRLSNVWKRVHPWCLLHTHVDVVVCVVDDLCGIFGQPIESKRHWLPISCVEVWCWAMWFLLGLAVRVKAPLAPRSCGRGESAQCSCCMRLFLPVMGEEALLATSPCVVIWGGVGRFRLERAGGEGTPLAPCSCSRGMRGIGSVILV